MAETHIICITEGKILTERSFEKPTKFDVVKRYLKHSF